MLFVAVFILPCKMPEKGYSLHPFDGKYEEGFLNPMEACQPNYSITSDDDLPLVPGRESYMLYDLLGDWRS